MRRVHPGTPCYPGTNLPIIRGGAPDDPPKGGGEPAAKPGAQPAPDKSAQPSGDGGAPKKDAAPAGDDWQKKYGELESKYKAYEQYGTPEQIRDVVGDWKTKTAQLQAITKDFQDGKITYAQAQRAAEKVENADPFDGWDTLEPREQAQRLMQNLKGELEGLTKKEIESLRTENKNLSANLGTQMKIAWQLLRLARANPDLDLDALIAKSTEASSYGPEQIIELMVKEMNAPRAQQSAIDAAIAKAKAEWQQELDKKKVPPPTRQSARLIPAEKPKTEAERKDKLFGNFMERLEGKMNRGAA